MIDADDICFRTIKNEYLGKWEGKRASVYINIDNGIHMWNITNIQTWNDNKEIKKLRSIKNKVIKWNKENNLGKRALTLPSFSFSFL